MSDTMIYDAGTGEYVEADPDWLAQVASIPTWAIATPIVVYPADLWRRTTDAEAEAIDAAMNEQPLRIRRLFLTAQTYQSDDPLWPLLEGAAKALFGDGRAAELLAPST